MRTLALGSVAALMLVPGVAAAQRPSPAAAAEPPALASGTPLTSAAAQTPPRAGRTIGANDPLATLTLVRSAGDRAVVRFGTGRLEIVSRGDRLGATGAAVVDVATGRLVLEEEPRAVGARSGSTLIVLKDGETGGTRYLARPDEPEPANVRPVIVGARNRM